MEIAARSMGGSGNGTVQGSHDEGDGVVTRGTTTEVVGAGGVVGETRREEESTPKWGAVTGWVDPLRSGDIFSRSWASPIPIRARNVIADRGVGSGGPGKLVSQSEREDAIDVGGLNRTFGATDNKLNLNLDIGAVSKHKISVNEVPENISNRTTNGITPKKEVVKDVDSSSPLWAQKVRSSFESLVRASPMPRALAERMGLMKNREKNVVHDKDTQSMRSDQGNGDFKESDMTLKASPIGNLSNTDEYRSPRAAILFPSAGEQGDDTRIVEVRQWSLIMVKVEGEGAKRRGALPVSIQGFVKNEGRNSQKWQSGIIEKRVSSRSLIDVSGTTINLLGDMESKSCAAEGFSVMTIRAFSSGFPQIWESLLGNSLSLATPKVKLPDEKAFQSRLNVHSNHGRRRLSMPSPPLPPAKARSAITPSPRAQENRRESIGGDLSVEIEDAIPMPPPSFQDEPNIGDNTTIDNSIKNTHRSKLQSETQSGEAKAQIVNNADSQKVQSPLHKYDKSYASPIKKIKHKTKLEGSDVVKSLKKKSKSNNDANMMSPGKREIERLQRSHLTWGKHEEISNAALSNLDSNGSFKLSQQQITTRCGRRVKKPGEFWIVEGNSQVVLSPAKQDSKTKTPKRSKIQSNNGNHQVSGKLPSSDRTNRPGETENSVIRRESTMDEHTTTKLEVTGGKISPLTEYQNTDPGVRSSTRMKKKVERYGEIIEYMASPRSNNIVHSVKPQKSLDNIDQDDSKLLHEWTDSQKKSLAIAMAKTDPRAKNYWQQVAKLVPGKSAGECFDRSFIDHPTPQEPIARNRNRRNHVKSDSPIAKMSDLDVVAPIFESTAPQNPKRKNAAARTIAARKIAREARWKYRAAELGVDVSENPSLSETHVDGTDDIKNAQNELVKRMKDQKHFDSYIERHLKRRPKGGSVGLSAGSKTASKSKSIASSAMQDMNKAALASVASWPNSDILEDGDELDDESGDEEERDNYFEL